ncbi:MAG: carboxypeptidase-like regulatory domain-containing protein [Bacteroidales bacterium]
MQKLGTLFLFIFISTNIESQTIEISGQIINANDNEPLPFANIMVKNHHLGTTSDENGYFKIVPGDSLIKDSLLISYIGFTSRHICINSQISGPIKLVPYNIAINEVIVKPQLKSNKIDNFIENEFKQNDCSVRYSPQDNPEGLWIPYRPMEPTVEALYFPSKNDETNPYQIKEVWLAVTNYKDKPSNFSLHLYYANESHLPEKDLLNESIIVEVKNKRDLIKLNLEKYNLKMPSNGVIVGFELLILDNNKIVSQDKSGREYELYSPYLNFTIEKEEQSFLLYTKGEWIQTIQKIPHFTKKNTFLYYKPAISLVLQN